MTDKRRDTRRRDASLKRATRAGEKDASRKGVFAHRVQSSVVSPSPPSAAQLDTRAHAEE